jgi:hypothetical protein
MFQGLNEYYHKELEESVDALVATVKYGHVKSMEEYNLIVGKIIGLEQAIERHKTLLANMEKSDD